MSTGVVVGRFQTSDLHAAHMALLGRLREHRHQIVLVGVSQADPDSRNPLPFPAIRAMLLEHIPNAFVLPIVDNRSDEAWSQRLDEMVMIISGEPLSEATLYHGRESFIGHYKGGIRQHVEMPETLDMSSTKVRKLLAGYPKWDESLFRQGAIWARMNERPRVMPTVDIAIFIHPPDNSFNQRQLVLIRKKDEKEWRLPGGFVDPLETLEIAVRREAREECGDIELGDIKFIQSFQIKDWRLRRSPNQILTSLFTATRTFGLLQAGDDAFEVKGQPLQFLDLKEIVEEHRPLIRALYSKGLVCLPSWQVGANTL